ncbi:Os06g0263100 [Oryza sativa Japonica Group]|uniref:Os06g0263100 protein n=2 Tax=Oryza sativa subsp. japonica TaxID=39947 RepID=A3BAG0_ORYSJ|nr:hypothetical protein OsJ_20889 [Oryza sativa Japonica Group]BAS97131.1 Os06g0263100 [Oryza sativa Japonica Group]
MTEQTAAATAGSGSAARSTGRRPRRLFYHTASAVPLLGEGNHCAGAFPRTTPPPRRRLELLAAPPRADESRVRQIRRRPSHPLLVVAARLLEVSLGEVATVEASPGRASATALAAAAGDASSPRLPIGVAAREEKEARRGIEREGKEARRRRRHHDDEAATAGAVASRRERRRDAERRRGVVLEKRRSLARERKGWRG